MKNKKCYNCGSETDLRKINPKMINANSYICKPCNNERAKKYYDKYRELVFCHYGKSCFCCNETEILFLSVDHVNNDGQLDLNINGKVMRGKQLYPKIVSRDYPDTYQILCMNCNFGKRMNNGVCPHKSLTLVSDRV